jgi:predicted lipoprotein with Yx(FWY)xxD motif
VPLLLLAAAVLLGGCGGGDAADGSAADDATVSVARVGGVGDVLVDADGSALYASEQESGAVRCVDGCAAIWIPLTVEGEPVAGEGVDGALAVVERPDGTRQVTYDGKPLYSFVEDTGEGTVTGNGLSDDFAGTAFTWHVMTPAGPSTSDANSEDPAEDEEKDPYGGGYER